MKECPYCYAAVDINDAVCPKCGREIERWKTGFYTREPLKKRITDLWNYERYSAPFKEGGRYFYVRNDGLQNQSVLHVQESGWRHCRCTALRLTPP